MVLPIVAIIGRPNVGKSDAGESLSWGAAVHCV